MDDNISGFRLKSTGFVCTCDRVVFLAGGIAMTELFAVIVLIIGLGLVAWGLAGHFED